MGTGYGVLPVLPIWFSSFHNQSRIPDWPKHGGVDPQEWSSLPLSQSLGSMIFSAIPYAATPKHTTASKIYGEPSIFTLNPGAPRLLGGMSLQGSGLPPAYHGSAGCQSPWWQKKQWIKGQPQKQRSTLVCLGALDSIGFSIYTNPIPCHQSEIVYPLVN